MLRSYEIDNMLLPRGVGHVAMPVAIDFTNVDTVYQDFAQEQTGGVIDIVQTVWIDNADNPSTLTLSFPGGNPDFRIVALPYSQGNYAVTSPHGVLRLKAVTTPGQKVNLTFYNVALPLFVNVSTPGVLVTPALVNANLDLEPAAAGDNILVAGVLGETVKLYRGIFTVQGTTLLKFTDGLAGTALFSARISAGGSLTFQASGVPWVVTTAGNGLVLNSSAAVNIYGGYGTAQS